MLEKYIIVDTTVKPIRVEMGKFFEPFSNIAELRLETSQYITTKTFGPIIAWSPIQVDSLPGAIFARAFAPESFLRTRSLTPMGKVSLYIEQAPQGAKVLSYPVQLGAYLDFNEPSNIDSFIKTQPLSAFFKFGQTEVEYTFSGTHTKTLTEHEVIRIGIDKPPIRIFTDLHYRARNSKLKEPLIPSDPKLLSQVTVAFNLRG